MRHKILIVDDEKDICEVLDILLTDEGYKTMVLYSGDKVIQTVLSEKPDLVLMDIRLNGMDGREICKAIKENETIKKMPVILISASDNVSHKLHEPGAPNDFVAKPFDLDKLVDTVYRHLA